MEDTSTVELATQCTAVASDNSTSGPEAEVAAADDVTRLLWAVCGPTLLVAGVTGNVLILATMTRRRMRGTSTCVYLCAMAVLDLMVLAAGLTHNWLEGAGYVTVQVSPHGTFPLYYCITPHVATQGAESAQGQNIFWRRGS